MRIEKGLLLKDWGLLKSQGKGIIYVMIGGAALMVGALNNSVIDREESAACFGIYYCHDGNLCCKYACI